MTTDSIAAKINSAPLINIPRNISLVIAKSNTSQQQKSTLSNNITTAEAFKKKINLSMPLTVTALNTTQPNLISQTIETSQITPFVSVAVQSNNIKSTESYLDQSKTQNDNTNLQQHKPITIAKLADDENCDSEKTTQTKEISVETSEFCGISITNTTANTTEAEINKTKDRIYESKIYKHMQDVEPSTIQISTPKNEDSQNALLKQLLQNSNATQKNENNLNSSTSSVPKNSNLLLCNQIPSARKVANVRAPCLGLVSSLEAQLARPVIPPVPATVSSPVNFQHQSLQKPEKHIASQNLECNTEEVDAPQNKLKLKTSNIISKETSFVSNPLLSHELPENILALQTTNQDDDAELKTKNITSVSEPKSNIDIKQVELQTNVHKYVPESNQAMLDASKDLQKTTSVSIGNTSFIVPDNKNIIIQNKDQKQNHASAEQSIKVNTAIKNEQRILNIQTNLAAQNNTSLEIKDKLSNSESIKKVNSPHVVGMKANNTVVHKYCNKNPPVECSNVIKSESGFIDLELRKKRKRDYPKQRRQVANNTTKTLTQNTSEQSAMSNAISGKKRQRKLSKVEEDYDSYIDNLMGHIRQMQPLQVLEPLLNRIHGVCSMYDTHNNSKYSTRNFKDFRDQAMNRNDVFGKVRRSHVSSLYDTKPFSGVENSEDKQLQLPTIQNDFYDQEFSPVLYKNDHENFIRLVSYLNEKNIEPIDMYNGENNNSIYQKFCTIDKCTGRCNLLYSSYPGLCAMHDNNQCLDRMSPIISLVQPIPIKKKPINIILKQLKKDETGVQSKKRDSEMLISKSQEENEGKKTVILSLTLASANNIMGILRDLASLLNVAPPSSYNILEKPSDFSTKHKNKSIAGNTKNDYKNISMQKILNGGLKMCRFCGDKIKSYGVRNQQNRFNFTNTIKCAKQNSTQLFCNKLCYIKFLAEEKKIIAENASKVQSTKLSKVLKSDSKTNSEMLLLNPFASNKKPINKIKLKYYNQNCFQTETQLQTLKVEEKANDTPNSSLYSLLDNHIKSNAEDKRYCVLCSQHGDGKPDGPSRLLNFDVDKWVHLNCALWSNGVYETISGGLMNFQAALQLSLNQFCTSCQKLGATIKCFKSRCSSAYHLTCAIKENCAFYKNKTVNCHSHIIRTEKENEISSLIVHRRVFIDRDEIRQMAAVMYQADVSNLLRIGSLTLLNMGQLMPHQLHAFHTVDHIYPIGYKVIRFFWSMKRPNKRTRYICSIAEVAGRPDFRIQVEEPNEKEIEFRGDTPKTAWRPILESIVSMRHQHKLLQLFPQFLAGEDLFGLTEPSIIRILESLPGVETLTEYRFKYGRNHILELPLAINPSGAARTEQKQRQLLCLRKPHTQRTSTAFRITNNSPVVVAGEVACPYSKQFVHSKSSQYKKMKQEWRNNVYLARSKIQGLGLYAARDIERHTMIIEYIGEVIRTEVSEIREKQYEAKNRGIYMFRLDENRVVDATLSGGLARYINHSCNPNCVTEIVEVDREVRIIIFAKRRISRGEELSYDYKFDIEDDANKIQCMCGATNCQKWMN